MADDGLPQIISRSAAKSAGLKRYFTGRPCRNGHLAERYLGGCKCVDCARDEVRAWRPANAEQTKRSSKLWRDANVERRTAAWRDWSSKNKASRNARVRASRKENPEPSREAGRRHYAKGARQRLALAKERHRRSVEHRRQQAKEYNRKYLLKNPEKVRAAKRQYMILVGNHRRRARKLRAPGSYTAADIREIRALQKKKCARCFCSFEKAKVHIDHINPLARGGSNDPSNIQLLCVPCNLEKSARDPFADAQMMGRLL